MREIFGYPAPWASWPVWLGTGDSGDTPQDPAHRAGDAGEARRSRILIVEDEFFAAWQLSSSIEDMGLEVCAMTPRGEEAVEMAAKLGPDLVLMDVNLGEGIDGIEAARRICERRRVPIIFITAYSDAGTLGRIRELLGPLAIVSKPVMPHLLQAQIAAALAARPDEPPEPKEKKESDRPPHRRRIGPEDEDRGQQTGDRPNNRDD